MFLAELSDVFIMLINAKMPTISCSAELTMKKFCNLEALSKSKLFEALKLFLKDIFLKS